jgi:hypothetical protein
MTRALDITFNINNTISQKNGQKVAGPLPARADRARPWFGRIDERIRGETLRNRRKSHHD